MSAIILDTETTGVDAPDVIELAWIPLVPEFTNPMVGPSGLIAPGTATFCDRWKPRKPISLGAMAAHHIIEADLQGYPEWPGSWELPGGSEYLIGHNIDFDWKAIGSPEVKRICTLALARKLWPEIDSHSLGALTYHILPHKEARELLRSQHRALDDAWLCHRVLCAELAAMPLITSWERLWAASEKARVPTHFTFGKYGPKNGQPGIAIAEVIRMDPGYISWCLRDCDQCKDEYWQRALRGQA